MKHVNTVHIESRQQFHSERERLRLSERPGIGEIRKPVFSCMVLQEMSSGHNFNFQMDSGLLLYLVGNRRTQTGSNV